MVTPTGKLIIDVSKPITAYNQLTVLSHSIGAITENKIKTTDKNIHHTPIASQSIENVD